MKTYEAPTLTEIGTVPSLTAAFGTSSRQDFSEFPEIQASNGSFDICDSKTSNNDTEMFCE